MKKVIKGKRQFSKIEKITFSDPSEFFEYLDDHGEKMPDGSIRFGQSFSEKIDSYEQTAKAILRDSNLPDSHLVSYENETETGWATITKYVESKGYEHDSIEGLSSGIVESAWRLKNANQEEVRQLAAFELGKLMTYARVYQIESISKRKAGSRKRNRSNINDEIEEAVSRSEGLRGSWRELFSLLQQAKEKKSPSGDDQ